MDVHTLLHGACFPATSIVPPSFVIGSRLAVAVLLLLIVILPAVP